MRVRVPPLPPYAGLAQLVRAPALQAGGHRFESYVLHHYGEMAQMARAIGSYPIGRGFDPLSRYQRKK